MRLLDTLLVSADGSRWTKWVLNRLLAWIIPFNSAHRFSLIQLSLTEGVSVRIPFRRSNKNHVASMHACAMATGGELAAGLYLLRLLGASRVRLVMKVMNVEYFAQGHSDCIAAVEPLSAQEQASLCAGLFEGEGIAERSLRVRVADATGKQVALVTVGWHLKRWDLVKFRGHS